MKILVLNAGSSSLKYQLFDMENGDVLAKGVCEKIGVGKEGIVTHKRPGQVNHTITPVLPDHNTALQIVLELLTHATLGVISDVGEIGAVGHRIVHGGEKLTVNVVGKSELDYLESIIPINPLHAPPAIAAIRSCQALMPAVKHVVVADSAFYQKMPEASYIYPIPYKFYEEHHVRRYGFHGTSHRYVSIEAAKAVGKPLEDLKMITCHLGNGSSISAIKDGICVDTTMGFTPQDGMMMGTRSGAVDPTIVTFIMKQTGMTPDEMDDMLNRESGFLGISGVSPDCREVMEAEAEGNHRAHLAMEVFYHYAKKLIGSFVAELNGVDVLVFTAGIGENDRVVRERICRDMDYLGIKIDVDANMALSRGTYGDISAPDSRVKVLVIPTNEEWMIAKETLEIISKQ